MKKRSMIFIIFALTLILFPLITAQESDMPTLPGGITYEQVEKVSESVEDPTIAQNYLKQEWTKILEKNSVGRVLLKISSVFTYLNFFWKPVLGMEYTLSWAFIVSVFLFIVLFYFIYPPTAAIFNSQPIGIISAFLITSLVGTAGVIKKAVDWLGFMASNKWILWTTLALTAILGFVIIQLGGGIKEYIQKEKENAEKLKTEEAQKVIQTEGKVAKRQLESYK